MSPSLTEESPMPQSNAVRACDVRAVYRLVGECRELGDSVDAWWQHFLEGLARLIGAGFAVGGEIGDALRPTRQDLGATDWGACNGFNRDGWIRMLDTFRHDAFSNLIVNAYLARLPSSAGEGLARVDLIPDQDWYRSRYYQLLHRTLGADATLACLQPVPRARGDVCEVYLLRAIGEPRFSGRDRKVMQEAMALVTPLVGGPLARFTEPSPAGLVPRARQVVRCLLEGDTDKQVGLRLGLPRHTVNQYTKRVFAHFGVGSRAELLARWVRRGWGGRFAWAEEALTDVGIERIGERSHLRDRQRPPAGG